MILAVHLKEKMIVPEVSDPKPVQESTDTSKEPFQEPVDKEDEDVLSETSEEGDSEDGLIIGDLL